MFDKIKGLYEFQKKAKAIQKELKKVEFFAEGKGITVTVNGAQEVISIAMEEGVKENMSTERLASQIVDLTNKAMQKSQKHAAMQMREITGGMIPGM